MNGLENYYNELLNLSGKLTSIFSVIPLIVGLLYFKYFSKAVKIFYWYLILCLFMNIVTEAFIWSVNIEAHYNNFWKPILDKLKIEDTNFFNGFSYFFSFFFIGWFYYLLLKTEKYSTLLKWIWMGLCVFQIINYFFIDGFRAKGAIGIMLEGLFLTLIPAFYLWYLSNNPPEISIQKNTYFWISIALFIPHLISFIYSFSAEVVYESNFILACKIKIIRNGISVLSEIFYIIAFTKAKYLKYL